MKFTDLTQDTLAELAETAPSKIVVMVFDEAIASLRAAAKAANRECANSPRLWTHDRAVDHVKEFLSETTSAC